MVSKQMHRANSASKVEPAPAVKEHDLGDNVDYTTWRLVSAWRAVQVEECSGNVRQCIELRGKELAIACKELSKVYCRFGRAAFAISRDISMKTSVLMETFQNEKYQGKTIREMVQGELSDKCAMRRHSGTWAVVWLYRFIAYVEFFVDELFSSPDRSASEIAIEGYQVTLKPHHPWLSRLLAPTLLKMIPRRERLYEYLGIDTEEGMDDFREFLELLKPVAASLDALLTEVDMKDFAAHKMAAEKDS
mmetsp:Transcript_45919/g.74918  ORF Transcript_45919/g.74918 Transcript_45919/m.74918 type:complete len:248 (-) Transcript_45919:245-988(-)